MQDDELNQIQEKIARLGEVIPTASGEVRQRFIDLVRVMNRIRDAHREDHA